MLFWGKIISGEDMFYYVNYVNYSSVLDFRKLDSWMFWGKIVMVVELCFVRKYGLRGFKNEILIIRL